jgi:hypothetical protein
MPLAGSSAFGLVLRQVLSKPCAQCALVLLISHSMRLNFFTAGEPTAAVPAGHATRLSGTS